MDKYIVISPFKDLEDKLKTQPDGREYKLNESFPATKREVSEERLIELSTKNNKLGYPVIKKVQK